jgi:pilus assembly protein Flp/PilA
MTERLLRSFGRLARRFRADESGATAIEYALIAAGVGATIAATVYNMGTQIKTTLWDKIGGAM